MRHSKDPFAKHNNHMMHILSFPLRWIKRQWKNPVHFGLWVVNMTCQRIFRINSNIPWMVHFTSSVIGKVSIGENVWESFALSGNCYIQGGNGVIIDDDTIFASGVKIISANHELKNFKVWVKDKPIKIGKMCWIGANVTILPGVELGDNVIVAAGAVVTKSFPSNCVIAGIPCKIIKNID